MSIQHVTVFRTKLEVRVFEEALNLAQLQLEVSDRVGLLVGQGTGWSGPIRYDQYFFNFVVNMIANHTWCYLVGPEQWSC